MKVLHVLDHSTPEISGYTIRSLNIVRSNASAGLEPVVVTSCQQEISGEANPETISGIRYYRTPKTRDGRLPLVRDWTRINEMAARIENVVAQESPDLIHAHSPCWWAEAGQRVARRRKIPMVFEVRGFWEDAGVDRGKFSERSLRYRLSRGLETRVARRADAVVAIAKPLVNDLIRRGVDPNRISHVPNVVDADQFQPQDPDPCLISDLQLQGKSVVGFIGTLFCWEGVEDLLQASKQILEVVPETRFLIVGGGEAEQRMHSLAEELGVAGHVHFVGSVPHEQIARYYALLDVVVYPRRSTRNTEMVTPLKPLEAMAMERAVLGSDVGGIRELVPKEVGVLYRAGDPSDLARKCVELVRDRDERIELGKSGRKHVIAKHNWNSLSQSYLGIYSRLTQLEERSLHRNSETAANSL